MCMPIIGIVVRVAVALLASFLSGAGATTAVLKFFDRKKARENAARKKIRDDATARVYKDLG